MNRKSLLYESKVEYGGWTINHVQGCSHGCTYPCYAMMIARRTGRVKTYEEWCRPQIVNNALKLLDDELRRFGHKIDSVHLCFTTDPFMFDAEAGAPNKDVVGLTTAIIQRLNADGIRVTTLTKGIYPEAFVRLAATLSRDNQYGISLVSLNEDFRRRWEPGAAPVALRMESLRLLADAGHSTWVSMEPYPTPQIDPPSAAVDEILEAVGFADKIVFGKWNYSKLANSDPDGQQHYKDCARTIADWCDERVKTLHIKKGTPLSERYSADVLAL